MKRFVREYIEFSGVEKGQYDNILNELKNLKDNLENELPFPTLSDLYMDTEHLVGYMEAYINRYYI